MKINCINRSDKIFLALIGFFVGLCAIVLLYNHLTHHYYDDFQWATASIFSAYLTLLLFYIAGIFITDQFPHISLIFKSIGMGFFTWSILLLGNTVVFTTPFHHLYDHAFNRVDRDMGFHLLPLLQWVSLHTRTKMIVWFVYFSLLFATIITPIALAAFNKEKATYHFYFSAIVATIIAYSIYYFFPTTSPAAVYPNTYFNFSQTHLLHYFQQEHAHHFFLFDMSAVISFPSLHATWAMLILYFLWQYRFTKYLGLFYTMLVLAAIILTGWHFLSDIIAGLIVAIVAIEITRPLLRGFVSN